jgi:hypothetical protein
VGLRFVLFSFPALGSPPHWLRAPGLIICPMKSLLSSRFGKWLMSVSTSPTKHTKRDLFRLSMFGYCSSLGGDEAGHGDESRVFACAV